MYYVKKWWFLGIKCIELAVKSWWKVGGELVGSRWDLGCTMLEIGCRMDDM